MPVRTNRMKQKLREGHPVFGGLLPTPEPTLVEVLGYAGYDKKGVPVSLSVHGVEEERDPPTKDARRTSVGTSETVQYRTPMGWLQQVTG